MNLSSLDTSDSFKLYCKELITSRLPKEMNSGNLLTESEIQTYFAHLLWDSTGSSMPVRQKVFNLIDDCIKDNVPLNNITEAANEILNYPPIDVPGIHQIIEHIDSIVNSPNPEIDKKLLVRYFRFVAIFILIYKPNVDIIKMVENSEKNVNDDLFPSHRLLRLIALNLGEESKRLAQELMSLGK